MKRSCSLRPGEKREWIPALEAVHLLAPALGSDRKAKRALVERLEDGAMDATAWWLATGYDVGPPYIATPVVLPTEQAVQMSPGEWHDLKVEHSKPGISQTRHGPNKALRVDEGDLFLGALFWTLATKEDRKQWDWSCGLFKCSYPDAKAVAGFGKPPLESSPFARMRMYALGVHFHRPHVLRIIDSSRETVATQAELPSTRGRKRSHDWPRWIAEVISLHEEEGIETLTATQLIEKIENRMASTGHPIPSKMTVYKAASETLILLRKMRAKGTEFP